MRIIMTLVLCVGALFLFGCATGVTTMGPGGAMPALGVTNMTYPNHLNPNMDYEVTINGETIEFMDIVESEATSYNILGIVSMGDTGYSELLEKARYQGASGVMNVTVDTGYFSILGVYTEVTSKLTGQAYKYKK